MTVDTTGPPGEVGAPTPRSAHPTKTTTHTAKKEVGCVAPNFSRSDGTSRYASQQVSFAEVLEFVEPLLDSVDTWPMVGTPEWCELATDDPRKVAALYDAARHHALRIETAQIAMADASRSIACATNWSSVSREIQQLNSFRANHPEAKRVVA